MVTFGNGTLIKCMSAVLLVTKPQENKILDCFTGQNILYASESRKESC